MRIAFFTDTYTPQINGVVTAARTFAEELRRQGHEVLIIAPKMKGSEENSAWEWRLPSIAYPFQREHRMTTPISRTLKQLTSMNIDVIHAMTPFFLGYLGLRSSRKLGIPVVHTYWTLWSQYMHYWPMVPRRIKKKFEEHVLAKYIC